MRIKTLLNSRQIGIMIGQVGIGLIAFPWIYIFGGKKYGNTFFWSQLICPPKIFINGNSKKAVQLRFMWFVLHVQTGDKNV